MTEEQEDKNKRIRPRERARGQQEPNSQWGKNKVQICCGHATYYP